MPRPRADGETHIRLISEGAPERCLTAPQPTGSARRYAISRQPAGGVISCGSAVTPAAGSNPDSDRRLSSSK